MEKEMSIVSFEFIFNMLNFEDSHFASTMMKASSKRWTVLILIFYWSLSVNFDRAIINIATNLAIWRSSKENAI